MAEKKKDKKVDKKVVDEPVLVRSEIYYSPMKRQGFSVKIRNTKGEFIPERDKQGFELTKKDGTTVYREKQMSFVPQITVRTNNMEYLSFFKMDFYAVGKGEPYPEDEDTYLRLEELADDSSTCILRASDHKQATNPEAFAMERENERLKDELEALKVRAAGDNMVSKDVVSNMEAELAKLRKENEALLDKATSPEK